MNASVCHDNVHVCVRPHRPRVFVCPSPPSQRHDKDLDRLFRDSLKEAVGGVIDVETFKVMSALYRIRSGGGSSAATRRPNRKTNASGCVRVCGSRCGPMSPSLLPCPPRSP